MIVTSANNRLERVSLTSGLRPNTATFTFFGWARITAVNASATAFVAGVGNGSSNFMSLRFAQNSANPTAVIRIGGSGNTWTTSEITVGLNTPFFFAIRRTGTDFRLWANGTEVTVTLGTTGGHGGSLDDYMIGQCRTAASPGATAPMEFREVAYVESFLTDGQITTLYNGGVCSHRVISDFLSDRTDVLAYNDLGRDALTNTGKLSHMNIVGSPTFNAADGTQFPDNDRRDYLSPKIFTAIGGCVGGWDFSQGTPDPEAADPGLIGFDEDGDYYDDDTNLLECGTAADIAVDSTTLPAGIFARAGGMFGNQSINLVEQAGYLRCLYENLSEGFRDWSTGVTLFSIVRDLQATRINTAIWGRWHEGMNKRVKAQFAYLQLSEAAVCHSSVDGGPTPSFSFNFDIAKSGQDFIRRRTSTITTSFEGDGNGEGELRVWIDAIFQPRDPDGSPVARGNPHIVPYDTLYNPTGTPPTNAWELWSSVTIGAVPTNLNSPTPPSGTNLPTLENGPRNMMYYGVAAWNKRLSQEEITWLENAIRSSQEAIPDEAEVLPNGNLRIKWTAPVWGSGLPVIGVSGTGIPATIFVTALLSGNGTDEHIYSMDALVPPDATFVVTGINNESPTLFGPTGEIASLPNFPTENNAEAGGDGGARHSDFQYRTLRRMS